MTASNDDRRRWPRHSSFLGGQIVFNDGLARIDCLIRNLTARGALFVTQRDEAIPDEFDFKIAGRARTFRARLVWRREKEFGVKLYPMPVSVSPTRLARRVRELEVENAALVARLADAALARRAG